MLPYMGGSPEDSAWELGGALLCCTTLLEMLQLFYYESLESQ